jgi:GntR family transcriptional regulator
MAARQTSKAPRYAQVAADLRAAIRRGDFGPDEQIPTEAELCAQYGVSRFTVREALRQLQNERLIRRKRGSGTVVEAEGGDSLRQSLSDVKELLQYAAGSTFEFAAKGEVVLSAKVARELCVAAGERWFLFTGLRVMAGHHRPIAATEAYVHRDLAPIIPRLRAGGTIFQQIERLSGRHIARVTQDIRAIGAGAKDAALLGVPRRSPCLRILRCYFDSDGRLVEMSSSVHPGDLFTYSMHIDADA